VLNYLEQIPGLRIAAWTQHSHQAFRRPFGSKAQFLESDRRVDVVTQDRLSRIEVARQKTFDSFPKQFLSVLAIRLEGDPSSLR
jgi:hypothetical protein